MKLETGGARDGALCPEVLPALQRGNHRCNGLASRSLDIVFNSDRLIAQSTDEKNPLLNLVATLTMTKFVQVLDRLSIMLKEK